MTVYEYHNAGNSEAQQRGSLAFLLEQAATGKARTGVLTGLLVAQTTTASASVTVATGAAVAQASTLDGASLLPSDSPITLDVLGANPMGGVPRNDIVVLDQATMSVRVIVGTPNAVPTDPAVPTSAAPLARLRHAASATTVPAAKIDDLRVKVSLFGGADEDFNINGVPMLGASAAKAGKRVHYGLANTNSATNSSGYATVSHGAGFTPTWVLAKDADGRQSSSGDQLNATTFRIRILQADGSVYSGITPSVSYICGE